MEAKEAIKKIEAANYWQDIFPKKSEYKNDYKVFALLLHPDRCKEKGAEDAFKKITGFRDLIEGSYTFKDDIATVTYSDFSIEFEGEEEYLKKSYDNFNKLISLKDEASVNFRRYLPATVEFKDGKLIFGNDMRMVSLNDLQMPLEHSRWVLNRLLEFSAWLNQIGYSHAGINPSSIFIVPETHGIICASFYHMTKIGSPLKTVSAKHVGWYPSYIFDKSSGKKPIADSCIDIELSKRTIIYLLGDKSGNGIVLKKSYESEFVNFLTSLKSESYQALSDYKSLVHKLYGKPVWKELVI